MCFQAQSQIATLVVEEYIMQLKHPFQPLLPIARAAAYHKEFDLSNALTALLVTKNDGLMVLTPTEWVNDSQKFWHSLLKVTILNEEFVIPMPMVKLSFKTLKHEPQKEGTVEKGERLSKSTVDALWQLTFLLVSRKTLLDAVRHNLQKDKWPQIPEQREVDRKSIQTALADFL